LHAVFYVEQDHGFILAPDEQTAQTGVSLLTCNIRCCDISYTATQRAFLQSRDWQEFISDAENNWLIAVDVLTEPSLIVRLEGISADVDTASNTLKTLMAERCIINDEVMVNIRAELRYLKEYYQDYWLVALCCLVVKLWLKIYS